MHRSDLWLNMQVDFDLCQAKKDAAKSIARINRAPEVANPGGLADLPVPQPAC